MKNPFRKSPSEYELFMAEGLPPTQDPIALADGRTVRIAQLFHYETYACLFLGEPNAERNKEQIDEVLSYAKEKIWTSTEPTLIPPAMREPKITKRDRKTFGVFDQPQYLPGVTCIAQLESSSPAKDKDMFGSMLTVVWFQDRYPFPIAPHVVDEIKKLDWNNLAVDYEP